MIQIKKFTFTNKNLIKKAFDIRHKVFVIEQKCPPEIEYEFEEESTHFLVINNTKPVAAARHRKTNIGYKLERFAVLKEERGKKYGYMILEAILQDLKKFNGLIYLHAQEQVVNFYQKLDFQKEGNMFEEAGIMHYKMKLIKK